MIYKLAFDISDRDPSISVYSEQDSYDCTAIVLSSKTQSNAISHIPCLLGNLSGAVRAAAGLGAVSLAILP